MSNDERDEHGVTENDPDDTAFVMAVLMKETVEGLKRRGERLACSYPISGDTLAYARRRPAE